VLVDAAALVIDPNEQIQANDFAAQDDVDFAKEIPEEIKQSMDRETAQKRASQAQTDPMDDFLT
jgi:hypothetical protein